MFLQKKKTIFDIVKRVFPKIRRKKSEKIFGQKFIKNQIFNPILKILMARLIFKAWIKYATINQDINHKNISKEKR